MQPGWSSPFGLWRVNSGHGRLLIINCRVDTGHRAGEGVGLHTQHIFAASLCSQDIGNWTGGEAALVASVVWTLDTGHWTLDIGHWTLDSH